MAITGSMMPWLYYGGHCRREVQAVHVTLCSGLFVVCLVYIAFMFDEFVRQRCVRAGWCVVDIGLRSFFKSNNKLLRL